MLSHPSVLGVILFSRNYKNPEQLKQLTCEIHLLRANSPLAIFVDQEGGRVQRFKDEFIIIPPMEFLVKSISTSSPSIRDCAWCISTQLRYYGIDANFAPVLDLQHSRSVIIGDRAFSRDPFIAGSSALEYMQGMMQAGMPATGKHFPGHGYVIPDSHNTLPVDERFLHQIYADLLPFQLVIANQLPMIMTAHIVFDKIDSLPVTLSPWWLSYFLRIICSYQGVIVSDDLEMNALEGFGTIGDRINLALQAGCDWLLVCNSQPTIELAIQFSSTLKPNHKQEKMFQFKAALDQSEIKTDRFLKTKKFISSVSEQYSFR